MTVDRQRLKLREGGQALEDFVVQRTIPSPDAPLKVDAVVQGAKKYGYTVYADLGSLWEIS